MTATPDRAADTADRELVFNAKRSGKNCLRLVGEDAKGPGTV